MFGVAEAGALFQSGYLLEMVNPTFSVAGLFAGIGGVERGLEKAGGHAELLCEWWEPARAVLLAQWPDATQHGDVQTLRSLPKVDVVTAGFPCTDLSQAGRTAGITGGQSSLVTHVFEALRLAQTAGRRLPWLLIENVPNMLALDRGEI